MKSGKLKLVIGLLVFVIAVMAITTFNVHQQNRQLVRETKVAMGERAAIARSFLEQRNPGIRFSEKAISRESKLGETTVVIDLDLNQLGKGGQHNES